MRAKSEPLDLLVWFSLLSLALLLFAFVIYQARRWLLVQKQQQSPESWMGEFRRLRMDGELSEEEFARIRAVVERGAAGRPSDSAVQERTNASLAAPNTSLAPPNNPPESNSSSGPRT